MLDYLILSNSRTASRKKFSRRKSFEVYKKVIELRKKEYSYSEIIKETGMAKSTVNNWLAYAGLTLSREHLLIQAKKRVENHVIATIASRVTRTRRKQLEVQLFVQEMKKHFSDPFFVGGILLYEAEGTKGNSNGFSNSDFRLILMYMNFLEKYLHLDKNKNMSFRVYVHETRRTDLERIVNFWASKLSIAKDKIKVSWKRNVVTKARENLDYVGQFGVGVIKFHNFYSKILAVSDIILSVYSKPNIAGSANGRPTDFGSVYLGPNPSPAASVDV